MATQQDWNIENLLSIYRDVTRTSWEPWGLPFLKVELILKTCSTVGVWEVLFRIGNCIPCSDDLLYLCLFLLIILLQGQQNCSFYLLIMNIDHIPLLRAHFSLLSYILVSIPLALYDLSPARPKSPSAASEGGNTWAGPGRFRPCRPWVTCVTWGRPWWNDKGLSHCAWSATSTSLKGPRYWERLMEYSSLISELDI